MAQSKGICSYCGKETTKGAMTRHLSRCSKRQDVLAQAEQKKGNVEKLYHLRIESADQKKFWLDLEMRGSATLQKLDDYLRAIWLECCGHLSQFGYEAWSENKISMKRKAENVFRPGVQITHIYDFGSTSETIIKVVSMREGNPTTPHPIALMARNLMPVSECIECGKPAKWFCMECVLEDDVWGVFCDEHAETHPHDEYGELLQLVNSPRMGMCGYEGPADPPY